MCEYTSVKNVAAAFKRFDIANLGFAKTSEYARANSLQKLEMRKALAFEWKSLFEYTPITVFNKATDHILKHNKFWPSMAEMLEIVGDFQNEYDAKEHEKIKILEEKKRATEKTIKFNPRELIEKLRNGSGGYELTISDELLSIAREYFKGCSKEFVKENFEVFSNIQSERNDCKFCPGNCKSCKRCGYITAAAYDKEYKCVRSFMIKCELRKSEGVN